MFKRRYTAKVNEQDEKTGSRRFEERTIERAREKERERGRETQKRQNINVVRTYLWSAIRARGGPPWSAVLAGVFRNFWPLNGPGSAAVLAFPLIKAPGERYFAALDQPGARN